MSFESDVADLRTGRAPSGSDPALLGAVISPATAGANGIPWKSDQAISELGAPVQSSVV